MNKSIKIMKKEKIKIKLQDRTLSAQLDLPDNGNILHYCLFAHCFTCTKDLKSINTLNQILTNNGFAVLRFDFTGLGESTGDFGTTKFFNNIKDLLDVANYMEKFYSPPSLLIGHSLGGAAIIQASQHIYSAKAIVTIGTPFYPEHLTKIVKSSLKDIEEKGRVDVVISGRTFNIGKGFYDDLNEVNMKNNITKLNKPLCIMHSPEDETVGIEHALQIFELANNPKTFISLDKADHLLLINEYAQYTANMIVQWSKIYL